MFWISYILLWLIVLAMALVLYAVIREHLPIAMLSREGRTLAGRMRRGRGTIQENQLAPPIGPRDLQYDAAGRRTVEIVRPGRGSVLTEAERREFLRELESLGVETRSYRVGAAADFPLPERHPVVRRVGL